MILRQSIRFINNFLLLGALTFTSGCLVDLILPAKPAAIEALTSTHQFGYSGEKSDEPITVQVTDDANAPMKNITVRFSVTEGEATVTSEAKTDAAGTATTEVQLLSTSGHVTVEAAANGLDTKIIFTFLVSANRTSKITMISGHEQEVQAGALAPFKLSVKVSDDYDNPAADIAVSFTIVQGNGTLSSQSVKTTSAGIAENGFVGSNATSDNKVEAAVGNTKAVFNITSVFPVDILSVKSTTPGMEVTWSADVNGSTVFDRYVPYKRITGNATFQPIATKYLPGETQFVDPEVEFGAYYDYKVTILTKKATPIESTIGTGMFGQQIILEESAADFEIDEERKLLYVSIPAKNKIAIYGLDDYELKSNLEVGSQPTGLGLSHDNSKLYVALRGSGDVALVDLDSKQFTLVDVEAAVGDSRIFDVVEGAPGKLFVSGNPQSNGVAYVSVIHLDQGNQVERFFQQVVRFDPVLQAEYGEVFYALNEQSMYKIDPFGTYTPDFIDPDYRFQWSQSEMVLSPNGSRLYFNFGALKTADMSVEHTFETNGVPAIDATGSNIYLLVVGSVKVYNAQTYAIIRQIPQHLSGYLGRMKLRADNSQILLYSFNYTDHTISVIPNPH